MRIGYITLAVWGIPNAAQWETKLVHHKRADWLHIPFYSGSPTLQLEKQNYSWITSDGIGNISPAVRGGLNGLEPGKTKESAAKIGAFPT